MQESSNSTVYDRDQVFERLTKALHSPDESEEFDEYCDMAEAAFGMGDFPLCVEVLEHIGY